MLTKAQIERFFRKECEVDEANAIARILKNNPGLLENFAFEKENNNSEGINIDEIKTRVWVEVDKATKHFSLDQNTTQELSTIRNNEGPGKIAILKPVFWIAAATAAAVFVLGWFLFYNKDSSLREEYVAANSLISIFNGGQENKEAGLEDGSCVILHPGAALSFDQVNFLNDRVVTLSGDAAFDVAKKQGAQFRVERDELIIDVLGTRFLVKSVEKDKKIAVQLFEGKVKITLKETISHNDNKEYFLKPGETFYFTKVTGEATIVRVPAPTVVPKVEKSSENKNINTANKSNNWYVFRNQSLAGVFKQLEDVYNQKIIFNPDDVASLYFIGRVEKTDSLNHVLETIAKLNNLTVEFKNGAFYLTKK